MDEETLERIDGLIRRDGSGNRSRVIRQAVRAYVSQIERDHEQQREAAIVRRHRARLARQAKALVRQQAEP